MRHVTRQELLRVLQNVGSAAIVGCQITTKTSPKLVGKDKPKDVEKVSTIGCVLNAIYENRVNKRLDKEGLPANFVSDGTPSWKVKDSRILSHHRDDETQVYVDYMPDRTFGDIVFLQAGQRITKDQVAKWLPEDKKGESRQGLSEDNEVVFRHCKLDSVVAMQIKGEHYVVID